MGVQGLNIGSKSGKTEENVILDLEDLLEIGSDGLELDTESPITADCDAVLTLHGNHGTSVVFRNGH